MKNSRRSSGYYDVNRREIYEGDIVRFVGYPEQYVITCHDGVFCIYDYLEYPLRDYSTRKAIEVVGHVTEGES